MRASRLHVENIEQFFFRPLPEEHRERFADDLRTLSHFARDALPRLRYRRQSTVAAASPRKSSGAAPVANLRARRCATTAPT